MTFGPNYSSMNFSSAIESKNDSDHSEEVEKSVTKKPKAAAASEPVQEL